jgi:hypothetical protein
MKGFIGIVGNNKKQIESIEGLRGDCEYQFSIFY